MLLDERGGIAHLAEHKAIHGCEILSQRALIEARFVGTAVGVGGRNKTEHFMRFNDFAPIFRDAERRSVQDRVETCRR